LVEPATNQGKQWIPQPVTLFLQKARQVAPPLLPALLSSRQRKKLIFYSRYMKFGEGKEEINHSPEARKERGNGRTPEEVCVDFYEWKAGQS